MANVKAIEIIDEVEDVVSLTDWSQFEKAGLVPTEITCSEYSPVHPSVTGCHTKLRTRVAQEGAPLNPKTGRPILSGSAEPMIDHVLASHGGGFLVKCKKAEGAAKWDGWKQLKDAGVELTDVRCEWCKRADDKLSARGLLAHNRPHKGEGRGLRANLSFWMTLSIARPSGDDDSDDE